MKYQEAFDLLKELVKEITGNSEISNDQNLIEFGLSSIQIMQIANQLRKKHIKVSFAKLIAKPTINAWRELLKTKTGLEEERVEKIAPGSGVRYTAMVKSDRKLKDGMARFCVSVIHEGKSISKVNEFNIPTKR